jgi:hypothetical protein
MHGTDAEGEPRRSQIWGRLVWVSTASQRRGSISGYCAFRDAAMTFRSPMAGRLCRTASPPLIRRERRRSLVPWRVLRNRDSP